MENNGVAINNEKEIDAASAEGKGLIAKYNITAVPTVIISPDFKEYVGLTQYRDSFTKLQADGWYVFTDMNALPAGSVYFDLAANKTVTI
jgi:hypothetical protein